MRTHTGLFTGRHFLLIMAAAFAIIITANLTLAYFAVGSFPGLDVANTYVASQHFNNRRQAQDALGWQSHITYERGVLQLRLIDAQGAPAMPHTLTMRVGAAATGQMDQVLDIEAAAGYYTAPVMLANGNWVVFIDAVAEDGTLFSERRALVLR
jgi:nitrogen fixation protein FixH